MAEKKATTGKETALSRREFLQNLGVVGGLVITGGGVLYNALRYIVPAIRPPKFVRLRAATLDELQDGQAVELTPLGHRVILLNTDEGVRAYSGTCTHLGCQVKWQGENRRFYCPCHIGIFNQKGEVVSGPPPRPLDTYTVDVVGNTIYVYIPEPAGEGRGSL